MGCYDDVIIEDPLPDGFKPSAEFQTYELGRGMGSYFISNNTLFKWPDRDICVFTGKMILHYCGDELIEYLYEFKDGKVIKSENIKPFSRDHEC